MQSAGETGGGDISIMYSYSPLITFLYCFFIVIVVKYILLKRQVNKINVPIIEKPNIFDVPTMLSS